MSRLTDYLNAIRECPNETVRIPADPSEPGLESEQEVHRLTYDFGIYDNYPILVKENYERLAELLERKGNFRRVSKDISKIIEEFPQSIRIIMRDKPGIFGGQQGPDKKLGINISMHCYIGREVKRELHEMVYLGNAICAIGQTCIDENIPLCLPDIRGWKDLSSERCPLFYPDSLK